MSANLQAEKQILSVTTKGTPGAEPTYKWPIIFAVFVVIGLICWAMQLRLGLQMTNLNEYNMWGLYITGFMIFSGVAAGSLLFAAVPYLFALNSYKPYSKIAAFVGAVSSIIAASLFITVDIGNPERVWLFITSGNLSSPMFWDFLMLGMYMVLSVIFTRQLIQIDAGKAPEKSAKPIAIIAFIAGIMIVVTSFVFAFQVARPSWNTPVQPVSFLLGALVLALGTLILLAVVLRRSGYIEIQPKLLQTMGKIAAVFLIAELLVVVIEVLMGLYNSVGHEFEKTMWLIAGNGAIGFWLEIAVIIGAIILLTGKPTGTSVTRVVSGAVLAIIGIYLIKVNMLQSELLHPLINFPGPELYNVQSTYYLPSLLEVGLSLGIMALGALLLNFGFRKLPLGNIK